MNNSLTLVAVADTNIKMTLKSLNKSREQIDYKQILLITSKEIKKSDLFTDLNIIKVKPIKSFKEYNNLHLPHAERLGKLAIDIPSSFKLKEDDIVLIGQTLKKIAKNLHLKRKSNKCMNTSKKKVLFIALISVPTKK